MKSKTSGFIIFRRDSNELYSDLIKKPLLWVIYCECARRARRSSSISSNGLKQGEFWLSKTEYKKFGLKETQADQITRSLNKLISLGIIEKTTFQTGSEHSSVYRLISTQILDPNFETINEITNEYSTNTQRVLTTNNDNNEKKETTPLKVSNKSQSVGLAELSPEEAIKLAKERSDQLYGKG